MRIIELTTFVRATKKLLTASEKKEIFEELAKNPTSGDEIKGTKGLRKVRFSYRGKGKSGGIRVIFFCLIRDNEIYLLDAYAKSKKTDLSHAEIKELNKIIEVILQ